VQNPAPIFLHGGFAALDLALGAVQDWHWFSMWGWINTYENTIFSGMNIHKSQLF
jgi:hypothetical protein